VSESTVEVEQLDAVYVVPADHPAPQQVRWQLDRVARTRLDAALDRALEDVFDPDDRSVCVIDELDVDIELDVDASDEDALAAEWARAIAAAVRAAVSEPLDRDRVRRFASPVDHLAAFLADVADGRAWDGRHYDAFDGLRALPHDATIREALERDPETARAALAQLAREHRLERVLAALGERGAERVARALARGGSTTTAAVEAVLAAWRGAFGAGGARTFSAADALRLAAAAETPSVDPASLAGASRALVALAIARSAGGPCEDGEIGADGGAAAAVALLAELARRDPALAERVAAAVTPVESQPASGTFVGTAYAGVFLLLQCLLDLDADRVLAALLPPDVRAEPAIASLRLALLARCLGAPDAAADPGVRLAAGAETEAGHVEDDDDAPARRVLLERLVHLGRADGRRLALEPVVVDARRFVLVRDADRDAWLALLDAGDGDEATAERAVRLATEVFGHEPEALQRRADDGAAGELAVLGGAPDTLLLLARAVLRELAVRLPGLDRSSTSYLRENFLVGPGMIRVDGQLLDVQLPPSPLRVVLQLAGLHGRALLVPWLGEVTLRLPEP
jgi:hypothetical protein